MRKALLVVSYGTSHAATCKAAIEAIERDLQAAFPERRFYRAWTSGFIRKKLKETRGVSIDAVQEAMERMLTDGVTDVLVQPTHLMKGAEFSRTAEIIRRWKKRFHCVSMGSPLLSSREDLRELARVLEVIFSEVGEKNMLALMGHGSAHVEPNPYEMLDAALKADGFAHFCVGTVEHEPGLAPVFRRAQERQPEKIYLAPLLVVAGGHALNDMAGDNETSWKSLLRREGFETVSILKGMGEYAPVREFYISHARRAEVI